jgi:hypothetical protein
MSESSQIKVLALINENSSILPALQYLKKRNYELRLSHKLMDGISELTQFKPDILLLSWNLKNTDIKKVHSLICNKFPVTCFVIGEDNTVKSIALMLAANLPNTVIPPIGGANIHTRIQSAIQRERGHVHRNNGEHKYRKSRDTTTLGGQEYLRPKRSEIPKEASWSIRVGSHNPENQVWETILYKNNEAQYYYYKGAEPPEQWIEKPDDHLDTKHFVFMSNREADSDLLSAFQNYSEDNDFGMDSQKSETPSQLFDKNAAAGKDFNLPSTAPPKSIDGLIKNSVSESKTNGQNQSLQDSKSRTPDKSLLEKSLNVAIELAMKNELKSFEAPILIDTVNSVSVAVIKSPNFKGYLVSGQADNVCNTSLMKKVFHNLHLEMKRQGETLNSLAGVLELQLEPITFRDFAKERADFVVKSQTGRNELMFAYLSTPEVPQYFEDSDLNAVDISLFEKNKLIHFDIFLHMPKNSKHIRYLKTGSLFSADAFDRLKEFQVKELFIKKSDENLFYAYCAKLHLERPKINRSIPRV